MPRLSHTQMRRFTALVRVEGAEKVIELSDEVKNKLLNEGYADDKGHGNFILSNHKFICSFIFVSSPAVCNP